GSTDNFVSGYKYFYFWEDYYGNKMEFAARVAGCGCESTLHIHIDSKDGEEIGSCLVGSGDGMAHAVVKKVTGRHALFFTVSTGYHSTEDKDDPNDWIANMFRGRVLFELKSFVFMK
ncbi:MAG: xylan 1,4-beta-xylosidase, partial [Acetatifactor sp.]|nr:xylan 1,4-beta-xylosidase [Acetatifactor sp.]